MLRIAAQDGALENRIVLSQAGSVFDHHPAGQRAVVAQRDVRLDNREGTDRDVVAELGMGADDCLGMDIHRQILQEAF